MFHKLLEVFNPVKLSYFLKDFAPYLVLDLLALLVFIYIAFQLTKLNKSEIMKKIIVSTIFFLLMIIITFSVMEAYFRFVYDDSDGLGFLKVNQRWMQRHVQYSAYDGFFFRDRKFADAKEEGTLRIGVIGDSLAFGSGIKNPNDRFSNLLEKKLTGSAKKVEVYNLAIPGYDTEQEIDLYNKIKNLNFDIIVWEYFLNDIQPKDKSTGSEIISKNRQQGKITEFLSNKSYFFDYLYWRLSLRYDETLKELRYVDLNQYKDQQVLDRHIQDMNGFIDQLHEENRKVVAVIFPSLALLNNHQYEAVTAHDIVKKVFADEEVPAIDLLPFLIDKDKKDLEASRYDSHPNEFVHALAAQKLADEIQPLLK